MNDVIDMPQGAEQAPPASTALAVATPAQLLQIAVQQGADLDKLERLMALQERWEANQAKKQFAEAFAEFKAKEIVHIRKDKHVNFTTQKGVTDYHHATIGNVVKVITEAISKYGFSHSWATRQDKGTVYVTCVLRHKGGHSEEVTLSADPDGSGGKNAIQAISSANTYLQRITLQAITGCVAADEPDDDGQGAGGDPMQAVRDEWIQTARACKNTDDLASVGRDGTRAFQTAKDREGYAQFRAAVQAHGAALLKKEAANG